MLPPPVPGGVPDLSHGPNVSVSMQRPYEEMNPMDWWPLCALRAPSSQPSAQRYNQYTHPAAPLSSRFLSSAALCTTPLPETDYRDEYEQRRYGSRPDGCGERFSGAGARDEGQKLGKGTSWVLQGMVILFYRPWSPKMYLWACEIWKTC